MQQTKEQIIENNKLKIEGELEVQPFEQMKYTHNDTFVFGVKVLIDGDSKGFVYLKSSPQKGLIREDWGNCISSFYSLGEDRGYVSLNKNGVRFYDNNLNLRETIFMGDTKEVILNRLENLSERKNIRGLEGELNSLLRRR